MTPDRTEFNLYQFQRSAMPILLGWALGSIVTGVLWRRNPSRSIQGAGGQFIVWGFVDGVIALLALLGARRKAAQWQAGEITPLQQAQQADQFEKIVWANAALDVGYVLGGRWWVRRHSDDAHSQGMGIGVMLQGAFLLIWDVLLAVVVRRRRNAA